MIGDNQSFSKEATMIWLSPTQGIHESSVYFDIRDIDLQYHGDFVSATVSGLVGDGSCEIWGEVFLGHDDSAHFLPMWTENGEVETLSGVIDEVLLQKQLVDEVKIFLLEKGIIGYIDPAPQRETIIPEQGPFGEQLAA
jgi:hypothetical protein